MERSMLFGDNRTWEVRADTQTATKHGEKIQRAEVWGHQKEKSECQMRMQTCGLEKWHWWTYLQGRIRNTDTEYSLADSRGRRGRDELRAGVTCTHPCVQSRCTLSDAAAPRRGPSLELADDLGSEGRGWGWGWGWGGPRGRRYMYACRWFTFHIVETNATLQHSYIPITKKAKQKYTDREIFPVYLREYPILRCQFSSNLCRDSTQSLSK